MESLIERGFSCLQDSIAMTTVAESASCASPVHCHQSADLCNSARDLHLSLYKYCDRFLRLADSSGYHLGFSLIILLHNYYPVVLLGCIPSFAHLFVRSSVCLFVLYGLKNKVVYKTAIGINVFQGSSKQCAKF